VGILGDSTSRTESTRALIDMGKVGLSLQRLMAIRGTGQSYLRRGNSAHDDSGVLGGLTKPREVCESIACEGASIKYPNSSNSAAVKISVEVEFSGENAYVSGVWASGTLGDWKKGDFRRGVDEYCLGDERRFHADKYAS